MWQNKAKKTPKRKQMLQILAQKETKKPTIHTATLDVNGMKCAGCVSAVERQLTQNPGVIAASVNLVTEVAVIKYNEALVNPENLAAKLTSKGFPSQLRSSNTKQPQKNIQEENKKQLWQLTTAAILLLFSSLGHLHHLGGPNIPLVSNIWFHWGLATLALFIPGMPILIDGWRGLWHFMPSMNTLVGLGTVSAYTASCIALLFPQLGWSCFFDEPVMLLGFILLGRTLEARARANASSALATLVAYSPQKATLIGAANETGIEISVEQVKVGEWVRVLPGEKIPVDGEVVAGQTTVDESMLTGEAVPIVKAIGATVTAGTFNQSGVIAVKTTRTGENTTLAQIIASVATATTRKAPIQQLADTVAGYFAYGVMLVATLTFLFWYFIGTNIWPNVLMVDNMMGAMNMHTSPLLLSLKLAIAVLVIACPCALGLATPTAILVGTSIGAEKGILIKGGDILQRVHQLDTVVFDKTGTLTQGKPTVTECVSKSNLSPQDLLQLAASVATGTNHPLATAILQKAKQQEIYPINAQAFYTEPGLGVKAEINNQQVWLGNAEWMAKAGVKITETTATEDQTVVYLAVEEELSGYLALKDILRTDAQKTIKYLQQLGLKIVLITGDQPKVAKAIAQKLGIEQIFAAVKPTEKATIIQSLQKENKVVAMVGDGINDAPALAQADVGIALHGGTEVAIETSQIVLMRERLFDVVESIKLSRATFNKIRQNLFWALGYNIITIPIAAGLLLPSFGVVLSPATAAAFMASSSVIVVSNSLLLRRQFQEEQSTCEQPNLFK